MLDIEILRRPETHFAKAARSVQRSNIRAYYRRMRELGEQASRVYLADDLYLSLPSLSMGMLDLIAPARQSKDKRVKLGVPEQRSAFAGRIKGDAFGDDHYYKL